MNVWTIKSMLMILLQIFLYASNARIVNVLYTIRIMISVKYLMFINHETKIHLINITEFIGINTTHIHMYVLRIYCVV